MPAVESTYSVLKQALITQLGRRPNLISAATKLLTYVPVNPSDMRTDLGTFEVVATGEAEGAISVEVFTDGGLRFDELLDLTVVIEVHGTSSEDTQARVDTRVNEILYEVLAEVSAQTTWDQAQLGLDVFDYVIFTPSTQSWSPGRLQQTGVFAARCELGIEARSRRRFN